MVHQHAICVSTFLSLSLFASFSMAQETTAHSGVAVLTGQMKSLGQDDVDLGSYAGRVALVVNVASKCGLTPQYEQLEELHQKYAEQGLVVLGFPCNQFGGQEPGTAEQIQQFCSSKYNVTFPLFAKIDVNGDEACGMYKRLTGLRTSPVGPGPISWNFEKFLIARDGHVVARFSPRTRPDAPEVISAIETELAKTTE